jgi:hypothetical protein
MDWGQQVKNSNEQALNGFYQTTRSRFERIERKSLIIDVQIGTATSFSLTLHEPLKIDKLSDVYLDSFTTYKSIAKYDVADSSNIAFLLGINEFNINSNSGGNANAFNKIIIPNSSVDATSSVSHKDKKFNYVCSINPTTLSQINGTITNLDGGAAFATSFNADNGSRFIAEFIIAARD